MNGTAMASERSLRRLWTLLFVAQSFLLVWALVDIARGEQDSYHNQHARLVVQALLGMCLALGFLARRASLKLLAGLGACAAIVASVWLAI